MRKKIKKDKLNGEFVLNDFLFLALQTIKRLIKLYKARRKQLLHKVMG
jgi:hypothetical protein